MPLRFAVMVADDTLDLWQARCLEALSGAGAVPILVIRRADSPGSGGARNVLRRLAPFTTLPWRLYVRLYVARRSRTQQPVPLAQVLPDVPVRTCVALPKGKFGTILSADDIAEVRSLDLDFILLLEFGILRGDILRAARHGVWSFHHDDPQHHRGLPPAFWEIYHGDAVSGAILQRLTERLDGGIILQRGWVKTIDYSYRANIDAVFEVSIPWAAKVCADLQNGVATYLDDAPTRTQAPIRYNPTAQETAKFGLRLALGTARRFWRAAFRNEQWAVGMVQAPVQSLLADQRPPVDWLPTPGHGRFLADPFGRHEDGALTILAEEYDYRERLGYIATMRVEDNGRTTYPRVVMRETTHLSYPYLLEHDGAVYCIPESAQTREVALYRADDFPHGWRLVATLIEDFAAADATVLHHDGRWWLFCTDATVDVDAVLHAWWAEDLLGPWHPHASNPIKTDVRSARPAGLPFRHDDRLYRPAQDSSRVYAGAVVVQRITCLSPIEFREETVARIEPDSTGPYPDGLHTLCGVGAITIVDGKREKFILSALLTNVQRLHR